MHIYQGARLVKDILPYLIEGLRMLLLKVLLLPPDGASIAEPCCPLPLPPPAGAAAATREGCQQQQSRVCGMARAAGAKHLDSTLICGFPLCEQVHDLSRTKAGRSIPTRKRKIGPSYVDAISRQGRSYPQRGVCKRTARNVFPFPSFRGLNLSKAGRMPVHLTVVIHKQNNLGLLVEISGAI